MTLDDWIMRAVTIIALMVAIRAWEDARQLRSQIDELRRAVRRGGLG